MLSPDAVLQNRYLIIRELGRGGMGAVYEAVDRRFNSRVALKQTLVADPTLRRAFAREAQLLNSLRHRALPVVSDFFDEADGQFLVMQYIPGEDLAGMLQRARLETARLFVVEERPLHDGRLPEDQVAPLRAWLHGLADAIEASFGQLPAIEGWQLVTMRLMRRRVLRDVAGPWAAAIDFRARMLSA